mmetsp:Transcript_12584/g.30624  ORF Transcript_12584/g.30624 Transcript_12584/m.30624 type:complete len:141 (-) Transcript_12584:476-898(-)
MSPERLAAIERERRKIAWHEKRMEKLKNEETLLLEAREYLRAAVRKVNAGPQQAQGAEQQASPPVTAILPTPAGAPSSSTTAWPTSSTARLGIDVEGTRVKDPLGARPEGLLLQLRPELMAPRRNPFHPRPAGGDSSSKR